MYIFSDLLFIFQSYVLEAFCYMFVSDYMIQYYLLLKGVQGFVCYDEIGEVNCIIVIVE